MTAVGVDVVEIVRVERLLRRHARLKGEVFTSREVAYCERTQRPAQHYAARLCAKEAVFKAIQGDWLAGEVAWHEIEVCSAACGAPSLALYGETLRRFGALGFHRAAVSLSHSLYSAIAVVVLEGQGAP